MGLLSRVDVGLAGCGWCSFGVVDVVMVGCVGVGGIGVGVGVVVG